MGNTVIRTVDLGKRYQLGERERYLALRDLLARAISAPTRLLTARQSGNDRARKGNHLGGSLIWALRDVSLEIQQGEVIGLIGRNGAGKSTLLKILSRITKPTVGWAEIRGRVGSLLEVGTGFHPELTGRENMYLSGAILGMSKREIRRKFDEIVAFAEIEQFLDTPVKHYSSGMYLKLAFSVAAHLEPEILLVDEVLAVGDASFQKKCLGKMDQVSREGRTILFVSHNMAAIKALCNKAVLMKGGTVAAIGGVSEVVEEYLTSAVADRNFKEWTDPARAPGNENLRICYVRVSSPDNKPLITIDTGVRIELGFDNFRENINLGCAVYVTNSEGVLVFESSHRISCDSDSRRGFYHVAGEIPGHFLNAGRYSVDLIFGKDQRWVLFRLDSVVAFEVENTATGRGANMRVAPGVTRPLLAWSHSFQEEHSLVSEP